jgi:hypothetical protein
MPSFRTVDARQAGPNAVGILVPPGRRTIVVVRPRSMDLDFLLVQRGEDGEPTAGFHEAGRGEASMLAENLQHYLLSPGEIRCRTEIVPATNADGFWVRAEVGAFLLIACRRVAAQPYRPAVFVTQEEGQKVAEPIAGILNPGAEAERELYVNAEFFGR